MGFIINVLMLIVNNMVSRLCKATYEVPFFKKHSRVDLDETSTYCLRLVTDDVVDSKAGCIIKVGVLDHGN